MHMTRGPFRWLFFHHNSNLMKIPFCSYQNFDVVIITNFFTAVLPWHVQNFVVIWWPMIGLQYGEVSIKFELQTNKANLKDLIAATCLVILLKLDSNRPFFSPCDLEIWWMTQKPIGHLFYATLSFLHHFVAIGEFKMELQSRNA